MNDREAPRLRIEPGQTLLRKLAHGSRITSAAGAVRVDGPPQWLAETMVHAVSIARPGAPVILPQAGWVALSSDRGAEVLIDPVVRPSAVLTALRTLVRSRRRRIGATSPSPAA